MRFDPVDHRPFALRVAGAPFARPAGLVDVPVPGAVERERLGSA